MRVLRMEPSAPASIDGEGFDETAHRSQFPLGQEVVPPAELTLNFQAEA
jgi:hypothetical protein